VDKIGCRAPAALTFGGQSMESGRTKRQAARTPLARFRCVSCNYGASRAAAPERCPMCGGTVWEYERWRPSAHGSPTPSQSKNG